MKPVLLIALAALAGCANNSLEKPASSDATLSDLSVKGARLDCNFSGSTFDYSATVANKLAQLQANASTPRPQGPFWAFNGEVRSQIFPAPGVTKVSATPDKVMIAIVQDPEQRGAEAVFASLKGLTPEAAKLLGQ